jgi:hypothetical protein
MGKSSDSQFSACWNLAGEGDRVDISSQIADTMSSSSYF